MRVAVTPLQDEALMFAAMQGYSGSHLSERELPQTAAPAVPVSTTTATAASKSQIPSYTQRSPHAATTATSYTNQVHYKSLLANQRTARQ
jgi:hypothetical protein